MIKYQLLHSIKQSGLSSNMACRILGLNPDRFYRWRNLYRNSGLNGLSDKPPLIKNISNRLLVEEEDAIFGYAGGHPQHHHGEIKYNLEKQDIYVSSSSIYRRLKAKNLIKEHKILKPKRRWIRPKAEYPHQQLAHRPNLYTRKQGLLVSYSHCRPLFAICSRLGVISYSNSQRP